MKILPYAMVALLACGCMQTNEKNDLTSSSIVKDVDALKEQIAKLEKEATPELLREARHVADSFYNDRVNKPRFKDDPNLKLYSWKVGLLVALKYIHLYHEGDTVIQPMSGDSVAIYITPKEVIREDGTIDGVKFREMLHKGQVERDTTVIATKVK